MNLSLKPKSVSSPTRKRGALAKVYTKDGRSIRVPLRLVQSTTCANCGQHPERQFTRQSAANPGFPAMVKNILLVVSGETTCPACQQSLSRFLQRFQLASKLQVRNATPQYKDSSQRNAHATGQPVQTELDQLLSGDAQELEGEFEQEFTAKDVIAVNVDVHAQYALQRMMKSSDPAERADGNQMVAAIKFGAVSGFTLDGIFKEDQRVPARIAQSNGIGWWQIIKPGEDAAIYVELTPEPELELLLIVIIFRDSIRSNPKRLDPALRQKWQRVKQITALLDITPPALRLGALDKLFGTDKLFTRNKGKVII